MIDLPVQWPEPRGSFQTPVARPTVDPDTGVLQVVCFNVAWLPVVLGALGQLLLQATWKYDTEAELNEVQERVSDLIDTVGKGCTMIAPGLIVMFAGSAVPDGWLACDGAAVSRVTYAELFAAIGETFGSGNGSTTFNTPDFASRLAVGIGQGVGLSTRTMADTGGEETHQLSVTEMPSHGHTDTGHIHSIHSHIPALALSPGELPVDAPNPFPESTSTGNASITSTGGDGAHENMPPFLAVQYLIKT